MIHDQCSIMRVRCRQITTDDIENVIGLLSRGFARERAFWLRAMQRLADHPTPAGVPRYGYLLEYDGRVVGSILLIHSTNGEMRIRCFVSSFYVDPAFRPYAPLLDSIATARKDVTYVNVTALPETRRLLMSRGFVPYIKGSFIAVPALCRARRDLHVDTVTENTAPRMGLPSWEADLLLRHTSYGCLSVICEAGGESHPFVFALRKRCGLTSAVLTYCRDQEDFVRFAGPLGRYLAKRGFPFVSLDANGPIRGLMGVYRDGRPKFFKGPERPRLGDEAYSERVLFGF